MTARSASDTTSLIIRQLLREAGNTLPDEPAQAMAMAAAAPQVGGHVVIDILMGAGQAFIDAKKVLRLLRVTDDPLGERNPTAVILSKFTAKNRRHVRRET